MAKTKLGCFGNLKFWIFFFQIKPVTYGLLYPRMSFSEKRKQQPEQHVAVGGKKQF
jgi:hypothetical protein